jgi:UPF0042 nucleotide-binding protein
LRPLTGLDGAVSDRVLASEGVANFMDRAVEMIGSVIPGFIREGKKFVTVAIGCTGGRHRSVAICEALSERLKEMDHADLSLLIQSSHRDVRRTV